MGYGRTESASRLGYVSIDFLDRQADALPPDEAAGNLGCAVSQRCLRSDRVLAEVDRSLTFGIEDMPCE